jgi:hypothetical protein
MLELTITNVITGYALFLDDKCLYENSSIDKLIEFARGYCSHANFIFIIDMKLKFGRTIS